MTALVVIQGLAGNQELAADIALVQGAALAFFYAFSANARSLILGATSESTASVFLKTRLLLALPLGLGVLWLSITISEVALWLAAPLVLRRLSEWFSEIALSELERSARSAFVLPFMALDVVAWVGVAICLTWDVAYAETALWVWAVVPLSICVIGCTRFIRDGLTSGQGLDLIPHLGSSAVVGITVYVFRLLIVLLVGKAAGGDLITAFAIGSLAGTVFGSVVGPSLILHDHRRWPGLVRRVTWVLVLMLMVTAAVTALAIGLFGEDFDFLGKSQAFWWATVLSLAGGAVMVVAQILRLNLIQRPGGGTAFGADVTANVLVIATIPFLYYLLGREALGAAYLATAVGALLVYGASNLNLSMSDRAQAVREAALPWFYVLILLPIFVQVQGGIFDSAEFVFDSGGAISRLPIPLSVFACFAGLVLLGRFESARFAFTFILFAFVAMLLAGTLTTDGDASAQQGKLILTAQFLLPMFAMAFGQMAGAVRLSIEHAARAFLLVLALIVPVQLVASWADRIPALRPDLGLFSIYQHLQYVPAVLGTAFILCVFVLWNRSRMERWTLLLLGPVVGIYAAASGSVLAATIVIAGLGLKAITLSRSDGRAQGVALAVVATVALLTYNAVAKPNDFLGARVSTADSGEVVLVNLSSRLPIWRHYLSGVTESASTLIAGQPRQPARDQYPSAHNYYLDLLYNFGLIGLLPILGAILVTVRVGVRSWRAIVSNPSLMGLLVAVLFTVLIDNSLQVGLRQPYPGIFGFFLWGLLVAQLQNATSTVSRTPPKDHG